MSSVRKLALALVLATGFLVSGPALGGRAAQADPCTMYWYTLWTYLWGYPICGGPEHLCGICVAQQ